MFTLGGILLALLCGLADIKLLDSGAKRRKAALILSAYVLTANFASLVTMDVVFRVDKIFVASAHSSVYFLKYAVLTAFFSLLLLLLRVVMNRFLLLEKGTPEQTTQKKGSRWLSLLLFGAGAAMSIAAYWVYATYGAMSADQMLVNVVSPSNGISSEIQLSIYTGPVLFTLLASLIFGLLTFTVDRVAVIKKKEKKTVLGFSGCRRFFTGAGAVNFLIGVLALAICFNVPHMTRSLFIPSDYIEEHFADPNEVSVTFPEQKRNLIFIYLESMENSYFSKELGGALEDNLMPDLAELSKEGCSFSHLSKGQGFGGHHMSTGATWSVASMVNMHTGLPLKIADDPAAYGLKDYFLPGAVSLGDMLEQQGYIQSLMFGADAHFGGLDSFYRNHGSYRILDYEGVIREGWLDKNYRVWWGFEDDKLYEYAKREITRLYESGRPFNFTMETADTHYPDGYLSKNADTPFDSQYANVIHYSQAETVRFVRWIQQQPFYDNTTVVLIGDHLSMDRRFFRDYVDPDYDRTCYSLILNPAKTALDCSEDRFYNRQWAAFDMYPTLLTALGATVDGHRLGMGTDLFSGESTLFEREGIEAVNDALINRSNFYNAMVKKPKT